MVKPNAVKVEREEDANFNGDLGRESHVRVDSRNEDILELNMLLEDITFLREDPLAWALISKPDELL